MPIGTGIIYNAGDLILGTVSGSGTAFLETKIAAATSSIVYFDSNARINSASLNSITVGTASYVSGSTSIITNLTASNISASGTSSFGMVGIGTTSPAQKLHVVGAVYGTTNGQFGNAVITGTGTGFAVFGSNAGGTGVKINLDSDITRNDLVISASTGYVGIGTTSPVDKLHVIGNTTLVASDATSLGSGTKIRFYRVSDGWEPAQIEQIWTGTTLQGVLAFKTNTDTLGTLTTKMVINNNGNVGIGTSNPLDKLSVSGSIGLYAAGTTRIYNAINATDTISIEGAGGITFKTYSGGFNNAMFINTSGNVGIGTTSPVSKLHVYSGNGTAQIFNQLQLTNMGTPNTGDIVGIGFAAGESTQYGVKGSIGFIRTDTFGRGAITFYTNNTAGTETVSTSNERMRIDTTGNVGIGTTAPGALLEISSSTAASLVNVKGAGGNGILFVSGSGNVGIGTTSPAGKLHVVGGGGSGALVIQGNAITSHFYYGTNEDTYIRPGKTAGQIFIADVGGNVGIGTTTTTAKLHVSGSTGGVFEVDTAGGATTLYVSASGNVGIGNSTPRALLDLAKTNNVGQVLLIGETATNTRTGFGLDSATAGMRIFCPNVISEAIYIGGISTSDGSTFTRNHSFGIAGKNSWLNEQGGNVGIGTTVPGALLDVSYGDYQNAGTIRIGADIGVSISRTNNTRKYGAITGFPYNNASASIQVIGIDAQGPTITGLTIGGGGTGFASPTQIQFYTTSSILIPGAERMRIAGDGNVGIGTTSPADKLHVIGNIRINGGDILNWGGQAFIQTIGANDMFFRPNSTLRMILTAAGNLGLGNGFTSPAYLLDVSGSSRHGYQASDTHQFTGSVSISGSLNATASWANNALTASSLVAANSYTITNLTASNISASGTSSFGMVGIGTSSPAAKLDVSANAAEIAIFRSSGGLANDKRLTITSGGEKVIFNVSDNSNTAIARAYEFQNAGTASMTLNSTGSLQVVNTGRIIGILRASSTPQTTFYDNTFAVNSDGGGANGFIYTSGTGGTFPLDYYGELIIQAGPRTGYNNGISLVTGTTSPSVKLRVAENGNVGIGTTSPADKLSVISGSVRIASSSLAGALYLGNDTSNIYLQRDNSYDLSLVQNGDSNSALYLASAGNVYVNIDSNNNDTDKAFIVQNNALKAGTELFRVSETGNVGIGTSIPSQKLHIKSTDTFAAIKFTNSVSDAGIISYSSDNLYFYTANAQRITIDTAGNVGIGTTVPVAKLQVAGNVSGSSFTSSISNAVGFLGTASWANNVVSASFATTAQTANALNSANSYTITNLTASGVVKASQIAEKVVTFTPLSGSITGAPAWYRIISGSGVLDSGRVRMSANYDNSRSDIEFTYAVRNYDTDGAGAFINITRASTYNSLFNAVRVIEIGNLAEPYAIDVLIGNYLNNTSPGPITCLYESQFIGAVLDTPTFVSASATGSNIVKTVYTTYTSGYPRIGPTYSDGLAVATVQGQLTVGYRGNYAYNAPSTLNYALLVSGSVGIGTTAPAYKLDVSGSVRAAEGEIIATGNNAAFRIYRTSGINYFDWASGQNLYLGTVTSEGGAGRSNKMVILDNGNVGIGTSSPAQKLEIQSGSILLRGDGNALFGTYYASAGENTFFTLHSGSGNTFHIGNDVSGTNYTTMVLTAAASSIGGSVGIGTTSPGSKLQINDNTPVLTIRANDGGTSRKAYIDFYTTFFNYPSDVGARRTSTIVTGFDSGVWGTEFLAFNVGSGSTNDAALLPIERVRIDGSGNLGIGTTNPVAKLQVNGNVSGSSFTSSISNAVGFLGTSSWAQNVVSASYATTAQTANALNASNNYQVNSIGVGIAGSGTTGRIGMNEAGIRSWSITPTGGRLVIEAGDGLGSAIFSCPLTSSNFVGPGTGLTGTAASLTAGTANALNTANSYTIAGLTVNGNISASGTISASKLRVVGTANVIELSQATAGSATYYVMDNTVETGGRRYRFGYSGASADKGSFTIYNATDNITPFTITTSGSVGIGTTGPSTPLHVFNTTATLATFTRDLATDVGFTIGADNSGVVLGTLGVHAIQFYTNATEKVRIISDGNVGIGTTTPAAKLAVEGGSIATVNITGSDVKYSFDIRSLVGGAIGFNNAAASNVYGAVTGSAYFGVAQSYPIVFTTAGTERMRIEAGGNVGIGTTAPQYPLDISGSNIRSFSTAGGAEPGFIADYPSSNGYGGFFIHVNNTRRWRIGSVGDTNVQPALNFWQEGTGSRMIITNTGNVGIGTTVPTRLLQVNSDTLIYANVAGAVTGSKLLFGSFANTTAAAIYSQTTSATAGDLIFAPMSSGILTEFVRIQSTGNVGIGTTSPSTNLHIGGTTASGGASGGLGVFLSRGVTTNFFEAFDGTKSFIAGVDNTQGFAKVGTLSNHPVSITQNNGSVIYINTSGNVGIGTTSPAVKLDVVGDIRTSTGILFGTDTAAANLLDDYEEGTWTGTVTGGTFTNLTVGRYTKIGRQVFASINPNTTAITGNLVISGLPFTAGSRSAMIGTGLPPAGVTYKPIFVDGATIVVDVSGTYAGSSVSTYFACTYEV